MKIKIVREIPQWILSSDKAAYHPLSRTIYLRRDFLVWMFLRFLHELGHHAIEKLSGKTRIHKIYDNITGGIL